LVDRFSKNPQMSNFMKIRAVVAEVFHADGQIDKTKLIFAFRNFVNEPKNSIIWQAVRGLSSNS
jgi:hypothetical protein